MKNWGKKRKSEGWSGYKNGEKFKKMALARIPRQKLVLGCAIENGLDFEKFPVTKRDVCELSEGLEGAKGHKNATLTLKDGWLRTQESLLPYCVLGLRALYSLNVSALKVSSTSSRLEVASQRLSTGHEKGAIRFTVQRLEGIAKAPLKNYSIRTST